MSDRDRELFRQAFRRHAATVSVLTYHDSESAPAGMTATSMCSLSADPPSLLVCIRRDARAVAEIGDHGRFGINLLSIGQRPIADFCSRSGTHKQLRDSWLSTDVWEDTTPRLADALAHLDCRVEQSHEAFSHVIIVGVIRAVWLNPRDLPPLLYHGGVYTQMESAVERAERFHWEIGGE